MRLSSVASSFFSASIASDVGVGAPGNTTNTMLMLSRLPWNKQTISLVEISEKHLKVELIAKTGS